MKIEDQVCTPEQAKKLKNLGVLQCAVWKWTERWMPYQNENWILDFNIHGNQMSAYSLSELGIALPNCISGMTIGKQGDEIDSQINFYATIDEYHDYDLDNIEIEDKSFVTEETEVQSRAALLLFMLDSKLLSVEQVNRCLMAHIELPETFKNLIS